MDPATSGLSPSASQHCFPTLDFFSLAGIDGSSEAQSAGRHYVHDDDQPLDDPSPITLESRTSSGPGHSRNPSSPASYKGRKGATPMDVDNHSHSHNTGAGQAAAKAQSSGHATPADELNNPVEAGGSSYDAMQAGLLQHQLEQIHMQSPMVGATNPTSPYTNMASMFLTSPPGQQGGMSHSEGSHSQSQSQSQSQSELARSHYQRKYNAAAEAFGGILTPAPSGDLVPDVRMDLMSPMQLEMLARADADGMDNFHAVALLSPALSGHSSYASPMVQAAYGGNASHHALQQLQHQQRQFQEQLQLLQEQQKQLQATAAAVAAATGSPYLMPQGSSSSGQQGQYSQGSNSQGQSRNQNGVNTSQHSSGGTVSTPSPGSYFSPLTSPALEPAVSRSAALRAAAAHLSPAIHGHNQQRAPHSLSALSSPALNPVGSLGGAQQTLSPALEPQGNGDLADPEYLNALQGLLDSNNSNTSASSDAREYQSPMLGPSSSGSTGPHRSLPAKSRPSPMMKPTHRHRQANSGSMPSSPMAFKAPQGNVGFLPPAAIDQRHLQQQGPPSNTPSPVDLAQIMPPPPVPSPARPKSLMPMTPASLMNLKSEAQAGSATQSSSSSSSTTATQPEAETEAGSSKLPARGAKKAAAPKRGSRLAPTPPKRALAIRPPGGGARKAAATPATEPENRRTSHKAAEQKRRDSLKAGFDELRLLLPPINTEALDPETGEPIPGSSAPRLLPKSSLVPDDNPNRGVSKVALLKFSNEYIMRLHGKLDKRDAYIEKLRQEIERLREGGAGEEVKGDDGEDLLEMDMTIGEEEEEEEDSMEVEPEVEARPKPRRRSSARKVTA